MKRDKGKQIFIGIMSSILPVLFTYLGQSNNALDRLKSNNMLGSEVDLEITKDLCMIIGTLLTLLMLTIPLIISKTKEKIYLAERNKLIAQWKTIFIQSLASKLGIKHLSMDIRIFVPKETFLIKLLKIVHSKKYRLQFVIKNIDVLANNDTTENLTLEVYPNPVGLVGQCYASKKMINDDNLSVTNDTSYNLSPAQKLKTKNLKFSLVCPIFGVNEEIISIVALDSNHDIKLINTDVQKAVENSVLNFCQMLYSCVPDLFKKEGGIL